MSPGYPQCGETVPGCGCGDGGGGPVRWSCIANECVEEPGGVYPSLEDCQANCGSVSFCTECCLEVPPFETVVNLGAGGWTNNTCANCVNINGQWICTWLTGCVWTYVDMTWCGVPPSFENSFSITASIVRKPFIGCDFVVNAIVGSTGTDDPGSGDISQATYVKSVPQTNNFNCRERHTLTKTDESHLNNSPCIGSLPAEIVWDMR